MPGVAEGSCYVARLPAFVAIGYYGRRCATALWRRRAEWALRRVARGAAMSAAQGFLDRVFRFSERGAMVRGELLGGLTTFMTMAYIIFVNAAILSACGMPPGGVMVATCVAAAFASILMGLLANLPIALAPGMGMNALIAFVLCPQLAAVGLGWQAALGMVFWSGILFLLLAVVRFREAIIDAVPKSLKLGAAAGIGVFIAFIGLQHAGIVVRDDATLVRLGTLTEHPALVALFGLAATGVLIALRVKGAVLLGLLATGGLGLATRLLPWKTGYDLAFGETLFQLELWSPFTVSALAVTIPAVLTLLFFDMFDTVGTLMGVAEEAGLVDDEGHIPNAGRALASDAAGTVAGSLFGTSTVTSYIESAAGVAAGARTGLSSIVVAVLFLVSLVALPVVGVLGNAVVWKGTPLYPVTAPALIVVGFLMAGALRKIDWEDVTEGLPAFLTVILMPLTFSISAGLAAGFVSYSFLKTVRGRAKEVHWIVHVIAVSIVLGYAAIRIAAHLAAPEVQPEG
jgi:AGZA family xanthine/uracil permease-like MFS transporter